MQNNKPVGVHLLALDYFDYVVLARVHMLALHYFDYLLLARVHEGGATAANMQSTFFSPLFWSSFNEQLYPKRCFLRQNK